MISTLINPALVKSFNGLDTFTDDKKIEPYINLAEFRGVQGLLGKEFYVDLRKSATAPGDFTGFDKYQEFWTLFLGRYCAYLVLLEASKFNTIQFSSQGMMSNNPDHANPVSINEVSKWRQGLGDSIHVLADQIRDYLTDDEFLNPTTLVEENNKLLFPLYPDNKSGACEKEGSIYDKTGLLFNVEKPTYQEDQDIKGDYSGYSIDLL